LNDICRLATGAYVQSIEDTELAALFRLIFKNFKGNLCLRLWDGTLLQLGNVKNQKSENKFTLVCNHPSAARAILMERSPLRLVDAYFRGEIDIEGDIYAVLGLNDQLNSMSTPIRDRCCLLLNLLRLRYLQEARRNRYSDGSSQDQAIIQHSRKENNESMAFHYHLSNEYYALWIDADMVYSCAYFEKYETELVQVQQNKLDYICRKLMLKPGEHLLDVGCGWGALVIYAAKYYGVSAHGITLSRQQMVLAKNLVKAAGLEKLVSITLQDYLDLQGSEVYHKIASIGLFEHGGRSNLTSFFSTINRLLKPAGLFLNQCITHDAEGWQQNLSTEFILRYVFPDGQLYTFSNMQHGMEQAGLEIADVVSLRSHFAITLRRWVARLEQPHQQALKFASEATFRFWHFYMAASVLKFESGELGIYQALAIKRKR
jgi:cyclopropane-fatty-acyl-phospholipid synthase